MISLGNLFDVDGLTPHGFCLAWDPWLLQLHAASNAVIALAYYSIPLVLMRFVRRRRDIAFPWVFWLFAAFILACGTTHLTGLLTLWQPAYWLDGLVKLATAILSLVTAIALWPLLPVALRLPSPLELRVANDALERQVAERDAVAFRLIESEKRFRAVFEHAPDPLLLLRRMADGRLLCEAANPASEEFLARTGHTLEGVDIGPLLPGHQVLADRCVAGWAPEQDELELAVDGRRRIVESVLVPLERLPGGEARVMATVRDLTERRDLETRLAQAQKMEAVGQLTGGMAHDFNNLLQALTTNIELAQLHLDPVDAPLLGRLLAEAERTIGRGAALTSQLLAFSRRQTLRAERVLVSRLVADIGELVQRAAGVAVQVATRAEARLWPSRIDPGQFEAALLNLVLNARDAMPNGGTLTIAMANAPVAGDLAHRLELPPGDYVRVEVADTGTGMPPEVLERAFDPFFTTKPVGRGSGLGLPQVQGFVRQSGGEVVLDSREGAGTTVSLFFPRDTGAGAEEPVPRQAPGTALPAADQAVLLVEDDAVVARMAEMSLQHAGFAVTTVRDGEAALDQLAGDAAFDVLISDVVLPGPVSGVDVAREARRLRPALRILLTSGFARELLEAEAEAPEFELLPKPYTQAELRRRLAAPRD